MALPKLSDGTWDQASCVRLLFGNSRVPMTVLKLPDVEVAVKGVARIGESEESKTTPGFTKRAAFEGELLTTDYAASIVPRMGEHGFTLYQFVIVAAISHPSIEGSFDTMVDNVRVVKWPGMEFKGGSEEPLIKKLGFTGGTTYERVSRGVWKCLGFKNSRPSPLAQVLQEF